MQQDLLRVDRSIVTVGTLTEQDPREETRYWLTKSPLERLVALELLRLRSANYVNTSARLQRFYTVAELIPSWVPFDWGLCMGVPPMKIEVVTNISGEFILQWNQPKTRPWKIWNWKTIRTFTNAFWVFFIDKQYRKWAWICWRGPTVLNDFKISYDIRHLYGNCHARIGKMAKERCWNKGANLGRRFGLSWGARSAFSGAKKPTSNEKWGQTSPPNLNLYSSTVPNMQIAREVFKLLLVERYNSDLAERVKKIDAAFDRGEIT